MTSGDRDLEGAPPSLVNDGHAEADDNGQRWLSAAGVPHSVEFSWSEPKTLTAARIVSGYLSGGAPDSPLVDFVLQYRAGDEWREMEGTRTGDNTAVDWQCRFKPVRASRVRLLIEKTPKDISRVWEIELYEGK